MAFWQFTGTSPEYFPNLGFTAQPNTVYDLGATPPPAEPLVYVKGSWQTPNPASLWVAATGPASTSPSRSVPSYIAPPPGVFNSTTGLYNVTKANSRTFSTALGKAADGSGVCHDVFIAGSDNVYNGSAVKSPKSWPESYRQTLASLGVASGGTGLFPFQDTLGASDSRIALTGSWASFVGIFGFTTTNGATATFTPDVAGRLCITYDNSAAKAPFTVKIGAAGAVTVTPVTSGGGVNTVGVYFPAGTVAANTPVLITAGGTTVIYHVGTVGTTGYHKHNLARSSMGAARAADTTYFTNAATDGAWDPTIATSYSLPAQQTLSALTGAGVSAHRITLSLLANDLVGGKTPAQITTSLTNIIAAIPKVAGCTIRIVVPWQFGLVSDAAWAAAAQALYNYADANGYQLLDWRYRLGSFTEMQAAGVLGTDGFHVTEGSWQNLGRSVAVADVDAA